jgi:hypothetical protein
VVCLQLLSSFFLRRREFYEKYRHDERMKLTDIVRYLQSVALVLECRVHGVAEREFTRDALPALVGHPCCQGASEATDSP